MYVCPIAFRASSPRSPSDERWNISSVSRKQRATVAMKSSFFVPKSRKRYGWEMPAALAMSSVDAPSKPSAAKTATAASRMSSRRSAALSLVVISTRPRLVMTHKLVKSLGDPVELGLGQPDVEREGERPLEGGV